MAAAGILHEGPAPPPAPAICPAPAASPASRCQKIPPPQDEEFAALLADKVALTAELMGALVHPLTGWSLEEAGRDIFG